MTTLSNQIEEEYGVNFKKLLNSKLLMNKLLRLIMLNNKDLYLSIPNEPI